MAIPPNVEQFRRDIFMLSQAWIAGDVPEDEFRQELVSLDQRVTELTTEMPHIDFSNDKAFIENLKGRITWTNRGYQASKLNGVMEFLATIVSKIFGK